MAAGFPEIWYPAPPSMESKEMRFSRLGVLFLLAVGVIASANCSYYNRILSRKDLVDGSVAYRERKFAEAEKLFRKAVARDPNGTTLEGRTAQVFLARTLHSEFIGNRQDKAKAEEAIEAYKKALAMDPNDQSSYKAVASLYENLQQNEEWEKWVTERANNPSIKPEYRAEALTTLASKQNSCAAEITETDAVKKKVKRDGKEVFEFIKPANAEDYERLKSCVSKGLEFIDKAIALEPDSVKNAKSADLKAMTDEQLRQFLELVKIFESANSYKASLSVQAMRLAEMEGRNGDRDRLKAESDQYRQHYADLGEVNRNIELELKARQEAAAAANNANANARR